MRGKFESQNVEKLHENRKTYSNLREKVINVILNYLQDPSKKIDHDWKKMEKLFLYLVAFICKLRKLCKERSCKILAYSEQNSVSQIRKLPQNPSNLLVLVKRMNVGAINPNSDSENYIK